MKSERWRQVESIFQAAIDLKIEDREDFLINKCKEDLELKSEIEKLIQNFKSAESFIERPAWTDSFFIDTSAKKVISDSFDELIEKDDEDFLIGTRVGVFEIKKEIGRGGMGAVYLGERADGEFQQNVAIKLIKRGMDSDFIIKRFRNERQILASFEHQYIARLLDGGTTSDGLPYFIMEFVEGDTLYDYCDNQKLDIKKRLELFRQICSAISYAHERQIIHRDIKPGNILVTKNGIPKLLDFGIAKIHESVSPTASIVRLMTPDYASPEQIQGDEIKPASDIYGLGVLLYELLSGYRPYNFEGNSSLHEISRVICEEIPKKPSEIIGRDQNLLAKYSADPHKAAESRNTNIKDLRKEISGDLDEIVMKAIAKDPYERYISVEGLSEDIRSFLNGQEVIAKNYVPKVNAVLNGDLSQGNHKSLAVLPFKTLNILTTEDTGDKFLGLGLADALITRLSKIRDFIVRPTSSIMAFEEGGFDTLKVGGDLKVDYILDGNIKRAGDRLRVTVQLLDIEKNATIWATSIDETSGDIFGLEDTISNKVVEALLPQLTGSDLVEFSKRGTDNAEAYEHYLRGRYYFNTNTEEGFAKAFVSFHKAIAEDENYLNAYIGLADYYCFLGIYGVLPPQECFQAAIEMAKKAVELDGDSAEAHATLGFAIHGGNYDWSKAEYHLSRSLEINPNSATAFVWLSIVRYSEGRFDDGLEFAKRAIKLDPLTPFTHHNYGWGLYYARRFEESISHYQKIVSEFPNYGLAYYGLSKGLRIQGRTKEALQAIGNAKRIFGDSNFIRLSEAETYAADGDKEKVQKILNELHKISKDHFVSPYHLALVYSHLGDKENALASLEKASEIKDAWLNWFGVEPIFDFLRDDERFQKILEAIGYDVFFGYSSIANRSITHTFDTRALHNLPTIVLEEENKLSTNLTADTIPLKSKRFWQKPLFYILIVFLALFFLIGFSQINFKNDADQKTAALITKNNSIVILPFKTENTTDENLGIGLSDALSNRLGYIRRLSVIAPNSGRSVKDKKTDEIGEKLKVGYILRGTLARNSEKVNINVELVDSTDETTIWTENFTTSDGNLFEIQTKIAEKIWTALGIEPLSTERQQISRVYTKDASAYELYLIARYQLTNRSPENIRKAINTFKQAVEIDPDFALAYAGLADGYALLRSYEFPPPAGVYENAKKNALKALELDENLVEAHTSLAYIKFYNERDREGAELEFRRAIQLNPSYSQAHHWFGLLLLTTNRSLDAVDEMKTAVELDPNSYIVKTALAMAYFHNKQYDEAIKECDKVLTENKEFLPALRVLRWAYLMKKDYRSAHAVFQKEFSYGGGETDDPGWYMIIAQVEALGENKPEITENLDRSVEQPIIKNALPAFSYEIALAYNMLGEKEKTLKWLEKAESSGDNGFILLEVDPRFENLRNEPRFQKLVKKLKKSE
jgi:serine/threonine protein kinase/tetratricopeptide (TPR) repeat protein